MKKYIFILILFIIFSCSKTETNQTVEKNEALGVNVSGTSNLSFVDEQMELLKKLVPNVKTVAVMYNLSEHNSKLQIDIFKRKLDEMGISYIEATITNHNEIQQMIGESEIPTDNMLAACMPNVISVTEPAKIPVICVESEATTMPIDYLQTPTLNINTDAAEKLAIIIAKNITDK